MPLDEEHGRIKRQQPSPRFITLGFVIPKFETTKGGCWSLRWLLWGTVGLGVLRSLRGHSTRSPLFLKFLACFIPVKDLLKASQRQLLYEC